MRYVFGLIGVWVSMIISLSAGICAPADAFYRDFEQPMYHGARLHYCTFEGQCGRLVADHYCQLMGYNKTDKFKIAHNVGLTHYIGAPARRCQGWRCDGFKLIRCRGSFSHHPPKPYHYRRERFYYPRYNHFRVDWCLDGRTQCGRQAAYSFCRRLGFSSVRHYELDKHVPATKAIGNQKLCFGFECHAFRQIECFR
ncbi:MAG: hypothetical protein CMF38_01280 [Legionellaceae bacterium]|nr:hypothetical protein [Legionellaceae bacterium]HCA89066.1 hypothetical protein [Legionellales bacterium]|tara:strand:- start:4588 stop:5178 length:591 start_codon:yes stop_codon:yes gene_type:complete